VQLVGEPHAAEAAGEDQHAQGADGEAPHPEGAAERFGDVATSEGMSPAPVFAVRVKR